MTESSRKRLLSPFLAVVLLNSCGVPPEEEPASPATGEIELQARAALAGEHDCATPDPTPERQRRIKEDVARRRQEVASARGQDRRRPAGRAGGAEAQIAGVSALAAMPGMKVPVYVHNIKKGSGSDRVADGHIGSATIDTTISLLNTAFASAGITFVKRSVEATLRPDWFEVLPLGSFPPSAEEIAMKQALREGGPNTLNIYTRGGTSLTSSALFPWEYWDNPWRDGISVHVDSFPRTGVDGDVVVHEVGHWLGLWHAFQNGCNAPGDEVADTPFVRDANRTVCTIGGRDSCPGDGPDLIDNYMDYNPNSCQNIRAQFTTGQIDRAVEYAGDLPAEFRVSPVVQQHRRPAVARDERVWLVDRPGRRQGSGRADQQRQQGRRTGDRRGTARRRADGQHPHHTIRKDWAWTTFETVNTGTVKAFGLGRHNGDLHVCFVRTDNSLRHIIRRPNGDWSSVTDVKGSAGGTDPSGTMLSADCGLLGSDMHYVVTDQAGRCTGPSVPRAAAGARGRCSPHRPAPRRPTSSRATVSCTSWSAARATRCTLGSPPADPW